MRNYHQTIKGPSIFFLFLDRVDCLVREGVVGLFKDRDYQGGHQSLCIFDAGEGGILIQWPEEIHPAVNGEVQGLFALIQKEKLPGVLEMIPAYCSLLVEYDPFCLSRERLLETILSLYGELEEKDFPTPRIYGVPTCYGGVCGPDLEWVASYAGLTPLEVVTIYSSLDYMIYMLGFSPGFPYLGGMDRRIAVPRLKEPRARIPAGSVGIAGEQTGIYPSPTPGGWRIIGQTPLQLFQVEKEDPVFLKPGNYLRFLPIQEEEFLALDQFTALEDLIL